MINENEDANREAEVQQDDTQLVDTRLVDTSKDQTSESATVDSQVEAPVEAEEQKEASGDIVQPQENANVINWRQLREKANKAERERDEAIRRLQENQGSPRQTDSQQDDKELVIGDDDLLEGKHIKSLEKKQSQRIAQLEAQVIESKIRSTYPDFDEVVNNETISMLKDADPELAESIASNPNLHSQAVTAYKSIKRYGFVDNNSQDDNRQGKKTNDLNKQAIARNSSKPRTVTSIAPQQGDSPLTRANAFANGLTDELKEQRWKEAQEIIKNG